YPRIGRSPVTRPVDDQPAWAVVCFFIGGGFRGQGVASALLKAAVDYAVANGAKVVEGYPVDPSAKRLPDSSGYHGFVSAFAEAGFKEVLRRKETRPIMRYYA
ncbi:MAG: GNAT family N-acetyltransferase, partial [Hyphomicrobiales bacterium]